MLRVAVAGGYFKQASGKGTSVVFRVTLLKGPPVWQYSPMVGHLLPRTWYTVEEDCIYYVQKAVVYGEAGTGSTATRAVRSRRETHTFHLSCGLAQ